MGSKGRGTRRNLIAGWLLVIIAALAVRVFRPDLLQHELGRAASISTFFGASVYLLLGCLRGFTFIPSTYLVLVGLIFFRPVPLFVLSLGGILISSACIYLFSESLQLSPLFEQKYPQGIAKFKSAMQKHQLKIIVGWSFFPLLPTDAICYVCGVLRVSIRRLLLGVLLGEGLCTGLYVFLGGSLVTWIDTLLFPLSQ